MIKIHFQPGQYSSNKDNIKSVFKILEYKYVYGKDVDNQRICIWKRKADNKSVKGIFNGSGKECDFIIDCLEDETQIFTELAIAYGGNVQDYNEKVKADDRGYLMVKAKQNVDEWFVSQVTVKQKGEPEYFYQKRKEKEAIDYLRLIELEYKKLSGG